MTPVRDAARRYDGAGPRAQGLSLLELLIVLSLIAIMAALVIPMFGGGVSQTELRGAAREVAAGLRLARSEALARRRDTLLAIDLENRTFRVDRDPRVHSLPRDIVVKLYTAQSDITSETTGSIRFFPDGGSTGGRVTVAAGERKFDVDVDWLTGRVSIGE